MTTLLMLFSSVLLLLAPGEIDPSDPGAGDFLDVDLSEYNRMAAEAYFEENYSVAIRYYLACLSRNIDDEISIYNVACCYALLGNVELTSLYLQRAVIAGYHDIDFIREDTDFDGVRDDPLFEGTMQHVSAALFETPDYTGNQILFSAEAAFRCLLCFPDDFDPAREYPLLVGLHGYGDSPENFIRLWEFFDAPDFIYACPRGPYPFVENNVTAFSWFKPYREGYDISELDLLSTKYVISLIEDIREEYLISEVFLFGFSQGCGLTWMTGLQYPEQFTGLIGFGGRLDTTFTPLPAAGDVAGLHAFVANGTMDQSVGVDDGMAAVEILEGLGIETEFRSWEGVHMVNRPVLQEAQEWMQNLYGLRSNN